MARSIQNKLDLSWSEPPIPSGKRRLNLTLMPLAEVWAMRKRYRTTNALFPTEMFPDAHLKALDNDPALALLDDYKFSNFSMEPTSIKFLKDIIEMYKPTSILELGSGASTAILSKHMKAVHDGNKIDLRYVSIDHDKVYLKQTEETVSRCGVNDIVTFLHKDIVPYKLPQQDVELNCYNFNEKSLHKALAGKKVDMVIVDGPIQGDDPTRGGPSARLLTYLLCLPYCINQCVFLLDDAFRDAELKAAIHWATEYKLNVLGIKAVGKGTMVGVVRK